MNKATLFSIRVLSVLLFINGLYSDVAKAQTPTTCLEIESILVDACGSPEGENEMVRFHIGPTPIATSNISVTWPSNSFLGISPVNSTTNSIVSALNATILSCGHLVEPVGGILPAGKTVLLITSTNVSLSANSFANLTDTLYVIFQVAGNTSGHFVNYSSTPGTRTLTISRITPACSDAVTYDKSLLVNQLGAHGGSSAINDGATVEFSWPGVANYVNNGCQAPFVAITADAGATAAVCAGGTIALTGTAGGNYSSVIWQSASGTFSNPASLSTNYTAAPGASGTIPLTLGVIGHCNDTVFSTVNITVNPAPTASIAVTGSTTFCAGGSVTFTASGGSTYAWSTGATTNAITVSTAGTYTVTSSNSCGSQTATQSVTVNPLPVATITPSGSTTICSGDSVMLTASGIGSFVWSTGATTSAITVHAAGTYTVTANNTCGSYIATQAVTVNPLPNAVITPSGSTTFCTGGSVTLTASGGTSYAWSTGAATNAITVSTAGTYTVTVTNSCGSQTATQTVTTTSTPTVNISSAATSFCAGSSLTLHASGTGSYNWTGGSTSDSIVVTTGGTYIVTASSSCGTASDTVIITQNPLPAALITPSGSTSICTGDVVTLTASGAGSFTWSTGATTSAITVSAAGTYTVTASNSCGSQTATQTVTTITAPTVAINSAATDFCAGSSLTLHATGSGSYTWTGGSSADSILVTTGGTYIVTAASSCGSASDTIIVTQNPLPVAVITPAGSTSICAGSSVVLNGSGGTTYLWLPTGVSSSSITAASAGTYTLTAINSCGSDTATKTITVLNAPIASITPAASTTICFGDAVTLNATGGGTYTWSTGQTGNSINAAAEGTYTLIASNACGNDTATIFVNVDSVSALFNADVTTGVYPLPVSFTNHSSASATGYAWDFGDASASTVTSPAHTFDHPGTYVVTLTAVNASGCTDTYSVTIIVLENPSYLEIPNVFTPNDDKDNDFFSVKSEGIVEFDCTIFDRWGIKVAEIPAVNGNWDGRTTSGQAATDGTYFYMIKAKGVDGKLYDKSGFIQLIRK